MDIKDALQVGFRKGINTAWQLAKLIIPIYFAVTILKHTPLMPLLARSFAPLLGLVGLPGEAALALVTGILINIYAGIAVVMPLIPSVPLGTRQITIIAIMLLICHNVPVESTVSHKTGASFWQMTILRLATAFLAGLLVNFFM